VDRAKQRRREHSELAPRKQTKFRRRTLSAAQEQRLVVLVTAKPDATLAELREALPTPAALSTIWRRPRALGPDLQKKAYTPPNNAALTSPPPDASGARGNRCAMSATTSFWMNVP
jgi:transposase